MSLDLESSLRVFFASAPQTVWPIQTLEISHSAITTWHLWKEPYPGVTSVAGVPRDMLPANFDIKLAGSPGHLDQKFNIRLGLVDVEDVFREQLDLIPIDTDEEVQIIYREYLSDDLGEPQATAVLEMESVTYAIGGAELSAVSPRLNISRTGELYTTKEVPMMRGFL
jgi:hypothetical protein